MVEYTARYATQPQPPRPRRRFKLLRTRRSWLARFWDPNELFGLKVTLLACCFAAGSLVS